MSRKLFCFAVLAVVAALSAESTALAQGGGRGGGRGGFGGGRGGFGGGGGPLQLIQRDDVQKELALTSSQKDEIAKVVEVQDEKNRERFREAFGQGRRGGAGGGAGGGGAQGRRGGGGGGAGGGFGGEAFARIQEETNKEVRKELGDILKKDQASRFAELEFRYYLERGAMSTALTAVDEEFDEEEIRDEQQKVNDDVQAKVAKMRFDAFKAALETVMGASKVEKFLGDDFTFDANQRGPGAGRRGRGGGGDGAADGNARGSRRRPAADDGDSESNDDEGGAARRRRRTRNADDA